MSYKPKRPQYDTWRRCANYAQRLDTTGAASYEQRRAARIAAGKLRDGDPLDDNDRWMLAIICDALEHDDPGSGACVAELRTLIGRDPIRVPDWVPRSFGRPHVLPTAIRGLRRTEHEAHR